VRIKCRGTSEREQGSRKRRSEGQDADGLSLVSA
jgi:hypothetical protein